MRAAKAIRLPPQDSEPDPDRCVVRGHNREYRTKHPGPLDVAIVVEVSDSSLDQDRGHKLKGYATAGIPVYWIVNLIEGQVEVFTGPQAGVYMSCAEYKPGQSVPLMIEGNVVE